MNYVRMYQKLNNSRDNGAWKWNDGTDWDDAVVDKLWSKGEPNNTGGEEPRIVSSVGGLHAVHKNASQKHSALFVCKVSCTDPSTTPLPPTTTIVTNTEKGIFIIFHL